MYAFGNVDAGRALYSRVEAEFLLREDPRITHRTLYYDILSAVARGASTPAKVGSMLERSRSAMVAPLKVLESTGYVRKEQDLLRARHPVISVADPVIRFNQLITLPMAELAGWRRGAQVWQSPRPTYHSKILGPHFEETAREWARSFAVDETGLSLGAVGTAEIADPAARTKHEIDLLAMAPGERPQSPRAAIALIGEAKATVQPRGPPTKPASSSQPRADTDSMPCSNSRSTLDSAKANSSASAGKTSASTEARPPSAAPCSASTRVDSPRCPPDPGLRAPHRPPRPLPPVAEAPP